MTHADESASTIVGWREWVSFPAWSFGPLKAKLDTGARTSAIHAVDPEFFEHQGERWVRFTVHPWQATDDDEARVAARVIDEREITSSSGTVTLRPVVEVEVQLGSHRRTVELTLTRRDDMGFRMLLGREALRRQFIVDPGRSYLTGRPERALRRKNRGQQ